MLMNFRMVSDHAGKANLVTGALGLWASDIGPAFRSGGQLETEFNHMAYIQLMMPMSNETPVKTLDTQA